MFTAVSRAPAPRRSRPTASGWDGRSAGRPPHGSDFNFDYLVSSTEELAAAGVQLPARSAERTASSASRPGVSAFAAPRTAGCSTPTPPTSAASTPIWGVYHWLDRVPKGRNDETYRHRRRDRAQCRGRVIAPFAHVGGVPVEEIILAAAGAGGALALARAYVWMALRRHRTAPARCHSGGITTEQNRAGVAVITGASSGIGEATARGRAERRRLFGRAARPPRRAHRAHRPELGEQAIAIAALMSPTAGRAGRRRRARARRARPRRRARQQRRRDAARSVLARPARRLPPDDRGQPDGRDHGDRGLHRPAQGGRRRPG